MMTARSLTASEFMNKSVVTFSPDTEVMDAIHELVEKQISGAPVVDERGNLVGILTERDCLGNVLKAGYYGEAAGRVSEYMSTEVEYVEADTILMQIAENFVKPPSRRFPVVHQNRLVGLISRRDVLRAVLEFA